MSPNATVVLDYLLKTNMVSLTIEEVCLDTKMSKTAVRRAIEELHQESLITMREE